MKLKKFLSSAGIEILVGQNDESNDKLTFRVGHPNDIWLHVSGVPGSHVVLRCGGMDTPVEKSNIREAAAIAAWFSKMRNGGKVSVNYCFVKDVSKPRKAKAGSVVIKNQKKITVRPELLKEI